MEKIKKVEPLKGGGRWKDFVGGYKRRKRERWLPERNVTTETRGEYSGLGTWGKRVNPHASIDEIERQPCNFPCRKERGLVPGYGSKIRIAGITYIKKEKDLGRKGLKTGTHLRPIFGRGKKR